MAIHERTYYHRVDFGCDVTNGFGHQEASITKEWDTVEVTLPGGIKGKLQSDGPKRGFTIVEPYQAHPGFKRIYGPGEILLLANGWRAKAT